ncbi:MAG TPA: hypothetical protein VF516_39735 [Kofleriaceae bacterium]
MQGPTGTLTTPGLVGLAAVAAVAALGGCVASGEDGSMLVLKSVAPPITATGGVCMFMPSDTEGELPRGVLDVSGGVGYQFVAQVASRITADPGQEAARTIFFRGANVDLTFPDAGALGAQIADLQSKGLLHFMSSISGDLPPNGLADKSFELIPRGVAAELNTAAGFTSTVVQATFTVVGDMGGGNVSSQPFHYSVTLGKQNLITDLGPCSSVSKSFMPHTGNLCAPGQDFPVDCCESSATTLKCPAVGTGP